MNVNPDEMSYEQLRELEERMGSVSKGLSPEVIRALPTKMCMSKDATCTICLENVNMWTSVMDIPCRHEYHPQCLSEYLAS